MFRFEGKAEEAALAERLRARLTASAHRPD
jgi:hypothetical protein